MLSTWNHISWFPSRPCGNSLASSSGRGHFWPVSGQTWPYGVCFSTFAITTKTSVYGVHTRPKFSKSHGATTKTTWNCLKTSRYPTFDRAGAWPLDKLELLCCNDQGTSTPPVTDRAWTRLGEFELFFICFPTFMTTIWHGIAVFIKWVVNAWYLIFGIVGGMLWIRFNVEWCGHWENRYLRIGELSTLQQSNIARSLNGIWPLGKLWGFFKTGTAAPKNGLQELTAACRQF